MILDREDYHINDRRHRIGDFPAVVYYDESGGIKSESYWYNDQLHRPNGPAIIYHGRSTKEYWLNNKRIYIENFISLIPTCNDKKQKLVLQQIVQTMLPDLKVMDEGGMYAKLR